MSRTFTDMDWQTSSDPVAMLTYLGRLHPVPHVQACLELGRRLEGVGPLAKLSRHQRDWEEGRRLNGPSVFHFQAIAQRVAMALRTSDVERDVADAVRAAVPDPERYRISEVVDPSDRDAGAPKLACGTRVRLTDGRVSEIRRASLSAARAGWLYEIEGELAAVCPARELVVVEGGAR